ncbi:MAG: GTPase HflX, partial [Actinomycetota bacterium]
DVTAAIVDGLEAVTVKVDLVIPYDRGDLVASLHEAGEVLAEHHGEEGTEMTVRLPAATAERLSNYRRS